MGDLFEGYELAQAWDEVFGRAGVARGIYRQVIDDLQPMTSEDLATRLTALERAFRDQGITFSLLGEERTFPLDLIPRLIGPDEWAVIETGVAQRVAALEAFLRDVYGPAEVLRDGVVPYRVVQTSAHFCRAAYGVEPPNGVRVHVSGTDLVRDERGRFRVLEDNIRTPSGVSYVMANRRAMTRVFPELFVQHRVRRVADYPSRLLTALRAAAPAGADDPTVVVLTPGVHNSAYFEHSLLARQMGVELVEGRDLVTSGGEVAMRTTEGRQRVDVIYRRVDDAFLDPLHFRPDSVVGCPGLLNAAREGTVTIANAVGNGVADDKLLYTYVPDLVRYYLGEQPVLDNIETFRLEDDDQRAYALERMDILVFKPVDASGGKGLVIGPAVGAEELDTLRAKITVSPRDWIAQRVVALSTSPTLVGDRLAPRHIDLRPFAVNDGNRVHVLPGGLTRVALRAGSLIVNSSQGGGSKDTWVLAPDIEPAEPEPEAEVAERPEGEPTTMEHASRPFLPLPGRSPDRGPKGQTQQQQQSRGRGC